MPLARFIAHNAVQLWCESNGDPTTIPVLLIAGAGAHAHFWTDSFCQTLVQEGYFVIRYDHRDTGLSSKIDFSTHPYTVYDLVEDSLSILTQFQAAKAHVVGHSMGGIIAQLLAITHPERLLSFTSMSVTTVGEKRAPSDEVMKILLENKPTPDFEKSLAGFMRSWRLLNGDIPLDEEMARKYTQELYTRSIHPVGVAWNHIRCQEGLPSLAEELKKVAVPGLFIHGEKDPLIPSHHSQLTAKDFSTDSSFIEIPKMGHMLFDEPLQQQIASILLTHFRQAETTKRALI